MTGKPLIVILLLMWLPIMIYSSLDTLQPSGSNTHKFKNHKNTPGKTRIQPKNILLLKTKLIKRVVDHVTWPGMNKDSDPSARFVIGIIGETPLKPYFYKMYSSGMKLKKKEVGMKYFATPDEIDGCSVLFVPRSARKDLKKILSIAKAKTILTIGDARGYAHAGIHINFLIRYKERPRIPSLHNDKHNTEVDFEINVDAIRESGFKIDMTLYRLAKIVTFDQQPK